MGFVVIICVMLILSVGILTLVFSDMPFPSLQSRLLPEREYGMAILREALAKTVSALGSRAHSLRDAKRRESVQRELYSALSILRNHASADAAVTTDYLLEQFAQADGALKAAYTGALRLLRTGRRTEAAGYFADMAGDPLALDFILLVLDWDAVPAARLRQTVLSFQNALKETRTTDLMRKNEILSDLVYLPVVAGVLIIFVNFIYVAYFAEQQALLSELFY